MRFKRLSNFENGNIIAPISSLNVAAAITSTLADRSSDLNEDEIPPLIAIYKLYLGQFDFQKYTEKATSINDTKGVLQTEGFNGQHSTDYDILAICYPLETLVVINCETAYLGVLLYFSENDPANTFLDSYYNEPWISKPDEIELTAILDELNQDFINYFTTKFKTDYDTWKAKTLDSNRDTTTEATIPNNAK